MEETDKPKEDIKCFVNAFDVWALGITIVIGGQYFGWNSGLSAGFGTMAIATCLMGSAYVVFITSVSEISSALPFAGGAYGLARCSLGFYPGFMIGCCEAIEYIFYVSASALSLGSMICTVFNLSLSYQPMIWFLFYVSALFLQIPGGRIFWNTTKVFAILSLLIVIIYVLGSFQFINYERNISYITDDYSTGIKHSTNEGNFIGGMSGFMRVFPLAAWNYVGVESLPFATDKVVNTRRNMPIGLITCVLTLFISSLFVYFVVCGVSPGTEQLSMLLAVFNSGFGQMFKLSNNQALILSIPATYATAFGFIYPYGRLIEALSNSKLLPSILSVTTTFREDKPIKEANTNNRPSTLSKQNSNSSINSDDSQKSTSSSFKSEKIAESTPYVAMIVGSTFGYFVCLLQYYWTYLSYHLFSISILSAFIIYVVQCIGFILLKTKFQTIKRKFESPFGITGAVCSGIIFSIGVISIIGFQGDNQFAFYTFLIITGLLTVYYYSYAKKRQTFSLAEQKVMFVAHVIIFNKNKTNASQAKGKKYSNKSNNSIGSLGRLGSNPSLNRQGSNPSLNRQGSNGSIVEQNRGIPIAKNKVMPEEKGFDSLDEKIVK